MFERSKIPLNSIVPMRRLLYLLHHSIIKLSYYNVQAQHNKSVIYISPPVLKSSKYVNGYFSKLVGKWIIQTKFVTRTLSANIDEFPSDAVTLFKNHSCWLGWVI